MKWLRVLLLICALPVQADTRVLNGLKLQPQERSQWCWAAVSAMAISAFPEDAQFRHLSQLEVVARRRVEATTISLAGPLLSAIATQTTTCGAVERCDAPEEPLLFDIDSDNPPVGNALEMSAFQQDIRQNKKPVIIRWMYSNTSGGSLGTHALIVIGYNTKARQLRVYDPLPLGSDRDEHLSWISYDTYLMPSNHDGKDIVPMHEFEQFRMRRTGRSRPSGSYKMAEVSPVTVPSRHPGGFEPPEKLQGPIDQYIKHEQAGSGFLDAKGNRRKGEITAGPPIAIVALSSGQLNEPLDTLLVRHAHAYVVPVYEGTRFVDSFQLLPENGGWRQGGYSSPKIASLLAKLSEEPRNKHALKPGEVFYLVSVPELAAYYLAHGFGEDAKFLSLDYGGREDFAAASEALKALSQLIIRIETDRATMSQPVTSH